MGTTMECCSGRPSTDDDSGEQVLMQAALGRSDAAPRRRRRLSLSISSALSALRRPLKSSVQPDLATCLLSPHLFHFLSLPLHEDGFQALFRGRPCWIESLKGSDVALQRDFLEAMQSCHVSIVSFHGFLMHEKLGLCTVTDFMQGGSLLDLLRLTRGGLPLADVVRVGLDVADGLKFLNQRGLPFRDLHSGRVLLDGEGRARLAAVTSAAGVETAGYRWRAPEVIGGDPETTAETWMSNVYSFGMVVWEMLTGETAYAACSPVQAAVGIAVGGLRPEIPVGCPAALRALVLRCWHSDPGCRPTFSEILSSLSALTLTVNGVDSRLR